MIILFLDRFFRKKEEPLKIEKLDLDSLKNMISKMEIQEAENIESEGKNIVEQIKTNVRVLDEKLEILSQAEIKTEEKNVYNIVSQGRKKIIDRFSSLDKIDSKTISYDSLMEFHDFIMNFFTISNEYIKSFYYVSLLLKKEIDEINAVIKILNNERIRLKEYIDSRNIPIFRSVHREIKNIKLIEEDIKNLENEKQKTEEMIKNKENIKKEVLLKINEIKQSKEYKSFLELSEELKILEKNLEKTETNIRTYLSVLNKPLKSFGRLETEKQEIIKQYIDSPLEFPNKELKTILSELKSVIENNRIELKEKMKEKVLNRINEVLEQDYLTELLDEYRKIKSDLKEKKKNPEILEKIRLLENQVSDIVLEKERLDLKVKQIPNNIDKRKQEILLKKQHIEKICLKINKKIKLS